MNVVGYLRVSTADQDYGVDAQRHRIEQVASQRGWTVAWITDVGRSGRNINRPGLGDALGLLSSGQAQALVVSRLDRLSRSLADFARLLDVSKKQGWGVVAVETEVDTTTPTGRMVSNVIVAVAQWEGEMIGLRTKEGLAEAKRRGVKVGRPSALPPEVMKRIRAEREQGATLAAIASGLNFDRICPAAHGAAWYPSSVRSVLRSAR